MRIILIDKNIIKTIITIIIAIIIIIMLIIIIIMEELPIINQIIHLIEIK
jgi:hypothetical protein